MTLFIKVSDEDEIIVIDEGVDDTGDSADFAGEPQDIIKSRLTPKMLRKLDDMLDSDDMRIVEKAAEKIRMMDKRLQPKDAGGPQVAIVNFDTSHLTKVFGGMREMLSAKVMENPERSIDITSVDDQGMVEE